MQSVQSVKRRKHVLLLEAGADLVQATRQYCNIHHIRAACLEGQGTLRSIDWADSDLADESSLAPWALLQWKGHVAEQSQQPEVFATALVVSKAHHSENALRHGSVRSAQVELVWVCIEAFEDASIQAQEAHGSVRFQVEALQTKAEALPKQHARATKPSPDSPVHWNMVKEASHKNQTVEAAMEDPVPGDLLEHATFGRCTVVGIDDDQDHLTVRVKSGRTVELSLVFLRLELIGTEGAQRVFRASRR